MFRSHKNGSDKNIFRARRTLKRHSMVLTSVALTVLLLTAYIYQTPLKARNPSLQASLMVRNPSLQPQQDTFERDMSFLNRTPGFAYTSNCANTRDFGIIHELRQSAAQLCIQNENETYELHSSIIHFKLESANMASTLYRHLMLDFRKNYKVYKPIDNIAQDGYNHDPRLVYNADIPNCVCPAGFDNKLNISTWFNVLALPKKAKPKDICKSISATSVVQNEKEYLNGLSESSGGDEKYIIRTRAIIVARKDDHNPYFQLSWTLMTWVMLQVLDWDVSDTQFIYMDEAIPTTLDDFRKAMLAPNHPVMQGKLLKNRQFHFEQVLVPPHEFCGPIVASVANEDDSCLSIRLVDQFRREALQVLSLALQKKSQASCTITIISRRPYRGRDLQRIWKNEDEILENMKREYSKSGIYKYGTCTFQSVDFVMLDLKTQADIVIQSDLIIGMHGAGMVNVLWSRPFTPVIEIFPRYKRRWGFRHICQYAGCQWTEYREGIDGPNDSKMIAYPDWKKFFEPIFMSMLLGLERVVETKIHESV